MAADAFTSSGGKKKYTMQTQAVQGEGNLLLIHQQLENGPAKWRLEIFTGTDVFITGLTLLHSRVLRERKK